MIDLSNIPEVSVGGLTAITYTRNRHGQVVAAHCARPNFRTTRRGSAASIHGIKRLESLFKGVGE